MSNNKNYKLKKTQVTFVPARCFSPHVKKTLRTCWYEVFLLCKEKGAKAACVDIYVVSDTKIKNINQKYRGIDKVTDVISLDFGVEPNGTKSGIIYLAKGVISRVAKKMLHTIEDEIVFLSVHGMLHICGYDHEKKQEEQEMLKAMKIVLENVPQYAPLLATYKRHSLIDY